MGYFDGLTDSSFKTDSEGRIIFYPRGILGKGYIIPTERKKNDLRNLLKKYYMVSLPVIIGSGLAVGWLFSLILIPILILCFLLVVKKYTKDLEITENKLKLKESFQNSANSHNIGTLWFMFTCSLLFLVASIFILLSKPEGLFVGILVFLFFSVSAIVILQMIIARKS